MNQNCNVTVHTSLPPSINKSEPFFQLDLNIVYIKWTSKISSNYDDIFVKVLWWGEESQGAVFIPRCVNLAGYKQNVRTHAIYPVRVPMHHFTTYLTDMSKLYFDIIDKNKHHVIGKASIDNIEQLAYNRGLQSLCNVVNENNVKIGELMVGIALEQCSNNKHKDPMPIKVNEPHEKHDPQPTIKSVLRHSRESINQKSLSDSMEIVGKSENLLDKLIEKSRKIRETISIDVKNDEINNAILKQTFPNIGDFPQHRDWIDGILVDDSVTNFSLNDLSKIHTESILKSSVNFSSHQPANWTRNGDNDNGNNASTNNNNDTGHHRQLYHDNDRRSIKLIAGSDSFGSESVSDVDGQYRSMMMTPSETDLLRKINKDISSDDDPCKRESIIEELFYRNAEPENAPNPEMEASTHKLPSKEVKLITNNNKSAQKAKAFEIYQSLSKNNNFENKMDTENGGIQNDDFGMVDEDGHRMLPDDDVGRDWYRNISSIKVYLDMLWLNSSPQLMNKNVRSRSQSPNYSSDRERMRRSYDSASSFNNSSTSFSVSKPPASQAFQLNSSHKYFIDYKFPAYVSRGKENPSVAVSTIRVPIKLTGSSYNITEPNGVKSLSLDHVSEFPVSFNDNSVIQKSWRGMIRFKLISQDTAKKETVTGVGVVPLRNIVSTNNFYRLIPIRLPRNKLSKTSNRVVIGSLAVRTMMVISQPKSGYPSEKRSEISFQNVSEQRNQPTYMRNKLANTRIDQPQRSYNKKHLQQMYSQLRQTSPLPITSLKIPPITLESYLCVSSIRYINPNSVPGDYKSSTSSYNLYFIGRLLWAPDHKIKSRILWGASKVSDNQSKNELENFKLSEKLPLVLTPELMQKLKNNFAILEVWNISKDKSKTSLYGLVKIPVNTFHMSFKNDKIRTTVLNNVYPPLSSDDWINIEDPITGKSKGQLHVLLAMGSPKQIENLQFSKENTFNGHWNRNYVTSTNSNNDLIEHSIELDIESLRDFYTGRFPEISFQETYFYIQYYFPLQNTISDSNGKNWENAVFRCVNNPIQSNVDISDTNRHRFRLPLDWSLKSMLSKHFDVLAKKHILFELYIKQYNPFPTSKSIAKGRLQVSSLFQLINQHSVDTDSLVDTVTQQQIPIRLLTEDNDDSSNPLGILNIRLCYRTRLIPIMTMQQSSNHTSPYDQPIVRIEILSATGLQYAAENLVDMHPELQYPSVTGVNAQVKFWLTDESNKQSRIYVNSKGIQKFQLNCTKTIPRTFTPKFDHICELLLGPIIDDDHSNSLYKTLAEKILTGIYQLNVEVYHDIFNSLYNDSTDASSSSKILIGKGRVSLADLLLRSNGFMGPFWLPVFSPMDNDSGVGGYRLNWPSKKKFDYLYTIEKRKAVGAVEIRLGFHDKADRRNIIQMAMDAGYVIPWTNRLETEDLVWQQMDVHGYMFKYITVNIEEVELSEKLLNSIFTPEAGFKKSSMKILTRYRMYKQAVSNSPNFLLNEDEVTGKVYIPINHEQKWCYRVSSDLYRYLRESKLEIQVWAIYGSVTLCNMDYDYDQNESPNDVRLLGSAFFELSSLILPNDQQEKSISHILPIWKRAVPNSGNSNVTITVNICGAMSPMPGYHSDNDDIENGTNRKVDNGFLTRIGNTQRIRTNNQHSFPAHIIIEKAVNLKSNLSGNENSNGNEISYKPLNYFVSFSCAEDITSVKSSIAKGYKDVTWNFECDTRLQYNLLTLESSTLDFKLFSSATDSEQIGQIFDEKVLVGVVKLDLSLLLKGFERVIGWYNITDMQGCCQGQMKVGVTPTVPLVPHSAIVSKTINHPTIHQPTTNKPFTIEDHQNYLSTVRMRLRGQPDIHSDHPIPSHQDSQHAQVPDDPEIMSKSFLFDTLKEKLKELDTLNETFKKKMEINENSSGKVEVNNQLNDHLQTARDSQSTMATTLKVDYGTNTEVDKYEYPNKNGNHNTNNNYIEDIALKCYDCGFENDRRDEYDLNEDLEESAYSDCVACLNEPELSHKSPNNIEELPHGLILDNPVYNGLSHQESESESERYSTSSCEIEQPQSVSSSRSISSCSHYNGYRDEKKETIPNPLGYEMTKSELNENVNDSWDEAIVPASTDDRQNHISDNPQKNIPQNKPVPVSMIPKFFPQSFDFHEKMKALKQNMEMGSGNMNKAPSFGDGTSHRTQSERRNQVSDITDKEASRLSRIFGLKKA